MLATQLLQSFPGASWRRSWCARLGAPLRDVTHQDPDRSCVALQAYQGACNVLELHGLGRQAAPGEHGDAVFEKFGLGQLSQAARNFIQEARVPSWYFQLCTRGDIAATPSKAAARHAEDGKAAADLMAQEKSGIAAPVPSEASKDQKPKLPQRRDYSNTLFDGPPRFPVHQRKSLYAHIRQILAETSEGNVQVRLREQKRKTTVSITGTCSKKKCANCTWRLMAWLGIKASGAPHLTIRTAGRHGDNSKRPSGHQLWTHREHAVIMAAFPGQSLLSVQGIRDALTKADLSVKCTATQMKQFVTRQNRQRQGSRPARRRVCRTCWRLSGRGKANKQQACWRET